MHNAEGAEGGGGGKEGREFMGVSLSLSLPSPFLYSYSRSGKWWERETADGRGRGLFGSKQETKRISDVGIGASPEDAFFAAAFPDTALYLFVPNIYVYIACRHGGERYAPRLNVQC